MAVMIIMRDVEAVPYISNVASHGEPQRQRQSEPVLVKPEFVWGTQDRHNELLYCKVEVSNILEIKAYELAEEEKVPVIKHLIGQEGLQLI